MPLYSAIYTYFGYKSGGIGHFKRLRRAEASTFFPALNGRDWDRLNCLKITTIVLYRSHLSLFVQLRCRAAEVSNCTSISQWGDAGFCLSAMAQQRRLKNKKQPTKLFYHENEFRFTRFAEVTSCKCMNNYLLSEELSLCRICVKCQKLRLVHACAAGCLSRNERCRQACCIVASLSMLHCSTEHVTL